MGVRRRFGADRAESGFDLPPAVEPRWQRRVRRGFANLGLPDDVS
jgi:hypothetical protein